MNPLRTISQAVRNSTELRCMEPVCSIRPYFFAAAMTILASSML